MEINLTDIIPLVGLYAETHYRFRLFPFSRYYRAEPEIIFDAPFRIEPDATLPVTLIIKDADRFPVDVLDINLTVYRDDDRVTLETALNVRIDTPFWHQIFDVDVSGLPAERLSVEASVRIRNGRRIRIVRLDNHAGLSHAPLQVLKAADPLPKLAGWLAGELHTHTQYGCDQVEFGAPLESIQSTARAIGLDWAALTDHSYNLDDLEDDYLHDDPTLAKWRRFKQHAAHLNRQAAGVVLVPGEELTCRSAKGRNVHMLVLGEESFLPGSGDSAQKWLRTGSELSVSEALGKVSEAALCAAAHPFAPVPGLERLLIRRGGWLQTDLEHPRLDGWQILNGAENNELIRSLNRWTASLLAGERKYIYAGNDSHGNFNRFRQVKLPMISLHEHHGHLFGKQTTHVMIDGGINAGAIVAALKAGRAFVSDGPALELTLLKDGRELQSGSVVSTTGSEKIRVRYKTTPEFGKVAQIKVLTSGSTETAREETAFELGEKSGHELNDPLNGEFIIPACGHKYLRAELLTRDRGGKGRFALTNPIWINKQSDRFHGQRR